MQQAKKRPRRISSDDESNDGKAEKDQIDEKGAKKVKIETNQIQTKNGLEMIERYRAGMILAAVGDAMGYRKGKWEFCYSGTKIHQELNDLGGLEKLVLDKEDWPVSDDTVLHLATAEALVSEWNSKSDESHEQQLMNLYDSLCKEYVECWGDMNGRAPGAQCEKAIPILKQGLWGDIPYNSKAGGCGASVRTMCLGMYFFRPEQLQDLIVVAIESGKMTHNHPVGFLGGVTSAVFTSYAIQNIPMEKWGFLLIEEILPKCFEYLIEKPDFEKYEEGFDYFQNSWKKYLKTRGLTDGKSKPVFPKNYGVKERDQFYTSLSFDGWGGSSGHDSVIIAYDALLFSKNSWKELCLHAALHGGDCDSTGSIAGCWYGVLYGFQEVNPNHYLKLEKRKLLEELAEKLYFLSGNT